MANVINNLKDAPGVIAKMAAQMLADRSQFCKSIDKADESDFNGKNGYQAGDTIQISKPARFVPTQNADISSDIQDIVEEKTPLALDTRSVQAVELTSKEIYTELGLKTWTKRVLDPAISAISQDVESRFLAKAVNSVFNHVGTPGSTTFNTATSLAAGTKLNQFLCTDRANRFLLLDSNAASDAVVQRNGLFQSSEKIAEQYESGAMGIADGFTYLNNELLPTHTNGADVVGAIDDASVSEGATSITVDGLTAAPTEGSVFTIADVNRVHPITKADTGELMQFVVGAGATTTNIPLSQPLYAASGGLQNINALPADDAAVTFVGDADGAYVQNLAFHRNAFRMVSVPLVKPDGTHLAAQETVDGMTVRVVADYDINTDKMIMRLDFLGGLAAVRPEWACRISG